MKNKFLLLIIFSCIFMVNVKAVEKNASVGSNLTEYACTNFQDDSMHISGDAYFGRCMQAELKDRNWSISYHSNNTVSCTNGNINPYIQLTKDGCKNLGGGGTAKFCTRIYYYDCERTSNGSKFTTTTKRVVKPSGTKPTTTTTTTMTTTTVPTTVAKDNNTFLSSLTLSNGTIQFNKNVKEYTVNIESSISFINVHATAESKNSKVDVQGNSNLVAGANKITITVTAEDGSVGTYIINVNKSESKSNNARLKSLSIKGYNINFNSDTTSYFVKTKASSLNIEAATEDANAIYMIQGNENLQKNSVIKIIVTAADGITMQEYSITIQRSSGSGVVIVIFILILLAAIGGGGYYFYIRRKNGGDKEYEYE